MTQACMAEPRASIIIVTYGQRELTEQCLRSLDRCLGHRLGAEWELVLIDNNSPDDTPELLHAWSDRAIVRLLDENRNFAGGCNLGAAEAHGEALVFLNNDTEVTPGALEAIVDQALAPGVSVAGCRLLFPHGTIQHAGVAFLYGRALDHAAMPQHVFHHQDQELAAARACYELDCVTAACMAVRAATFRGVGGFDEGYRNGLEDVDLCLRIRSAGERIIYRGDATVIHYEGASRGKGPQLWATSERAAAMRDNDLRFVARWATQLDQDDELAARLWDAALEDHPPGRLVTTAEIVVLGQPGGIGPAADEARALLSALVSRGDIPAAVDWPVPTVVPRLNRSMAKLLAHARQRRPVSGARWVVVPSGAHDPHEVPSPPIVRVARSQTAFDLSDAAAVWATCPRVAQDLIEKGLAGDLVSVIPPPVLPAPPGGGGAGVLAILPVHEPDQARLVLDALRALPARVSVRLLPTVVTLGLDRHVSDAIPRAELLGPCSDEARFAELAATADVVVAVDTADRFERRALVAAGVGSASITCNPGGPAAAVLGDAGLADRHSLATTLDKLLSDPGDRIKRAECVANACSPESLTHKLCTDETRATRWFS